MGKCKKCDSSCKTCADEKDQCTSCFKGFTLVFTEGGNRKCDANDPMSKSALKEEIKDIKACKKGFYLNASNKCKACDSSCKTCADEKDQCTSCPDGFKLVYDSTGDRSCEE